MKIKTKLFRVKKGENVNLKKWATLVKPIYSSKDQYGSILAEHVRRMSRLQNLHYASNRRALLLIFQGMDGAGKDGAIKHVMSGVNPQGCQVFSFKHPTATELEHDFLWRTTRDLPERGRIGIFNRSYYEEVLITHVHPEILNGEGLSGLIRRAHVHHHFWKERYQSINHLEQHLCRNGTQIIKFFLHLSEKEQTKRFLGRIDDTEKNWKLSVADMKERGYWKKYQRAYEKCLSATSTKAAPWYVIPADDKLNARLVVSQVILECFEGFKMKYPKPNAKRTEELKAIRKKLTASLKNFR